MAGLPHWTNSRAAINYYEPIFQNQFEVIITPPASISQDVDLLVEHVKSIDGLPEILPGVVEQKYKFASRRYAGGEPSTSDLQFSTSFEVNLDDQNSMTVYKILRQWADLIYNPLTGAMGLKTDYVGSMLISVFNKRGDVFRRIRIPSCFIATSINEMPLSYDQGNAIYTVNIEWKADYWDDQFI